ncbi:hypothetical protein QGP82_21525 [Leptothoe sp. LEGE 181152]|nr:hypothetical protein [Leptothoe sp. LEGE 181152]
MIYEVLHSDLTHFLGNHAFLLADATEKSLNSTPPANQNFPEKFLVAFIVPLAFGFFTVLIEFGSSVSKGLVLTRLGNIYRIWERKNNELNANLGNPIEELNKRNNMIAVDLMHSLLPSDILIHFRGVGINWVAGAMAIDVSNSIQGTASEGTGLISYSHFLMGIGIFGLGVVINMLSPERERAKRYLSIIIILCGFWSAFTALLEQFQ